MPSGSTEGRFISTLAQRSHILYFSFKENRFFFFSKFKFHEVPNTRPNFFVKIVNQPAPIFSPFKTNFFFALQRYQKIKIITRHNRPSVPRLINGVLRKFTIWFRYSTPKKKAPKCPLKNYSHGWSKWYSTYDDLRFWKKKKKRKTPTIVKNAKPKSIPDAAPPVRGVISVSKLDNFYFRSRNRNRCGR